jgi:hypothetical protein
MFFVFSDAVVKRGHCTRDATPVEWSEIGNRAEKNVRQ